jgi:hypothetical protein
MLYAQASTPVAYAFHTSGQPAVRKMAAMRQQ